MRKTLKIEFHRAFINRNFLYAIILGCFISIYHIFQNVIPLTKSMDMWIRSGAYPCSVFNSWIGGESHSLQSTLYFFIIPILGTIPFAHSFHFDLHNKYASQILVKTKKTNYLISKFFATWISAGCVVVIPLIVNLVGTSLFIPAVIPESTAMTFAIAEKSMWSGVFYSHPFVYILGYFIIIFMYSGLYSCLALVTTYFTDNKFAIVLSPFLFYIFIYFIISLLLDPKYNPMSFINPTQPYPVSLLFVILMLFGIFSVVFSIFMFRGMKREIL